MLNLANDPGSWRRHAGPPRTIEHETHANGFQARLDRAHQVAETLSSRFCAAYELVDENVNYEALCSPLSTLARSPPLDGPGLR